MARSFGDKNGEKENLAGAIRRAKDDVHFSFRVVTIVYPIGWVSALVYPATLGHANHFQEVVFPQGGALSIMWLLVCLSTLLELQASYRKLDEE
ncbi:hypothetical protein KFL_001850210 [Klebsormidium nitens]|uniref:Uncharacterized protein n=1 Tax=Klebsormidium nitens TaxID=105231 RepID=A0A1Y1I6J7_KLENI|nr:hypothetical protein KFL_001850210 [Klebsormidium nitens]|eukprot:GAQ84346.1 hypothetical protein KFL_001850210 [Klebsormidium nitens]